MKNSKIRFIALLSTCILATTALIGCSGSQITDATPPSNKVQAPAADQSPSDKSENDKNDSSVTYQVQIEYYEKLIADLEDRLLNEKEENFIEISEYKQMIKDLEGSISALSDKIAELQVNQSPAPNSGVAENKPTPSPEGAGSSSNNGSTGKPDNVTIIDKEEQTTAKPEKEPAPDKTPVVNETVNETVNEPFDYVIKDGKITITAYKGNEKSITIPESIDSLPVASIGEGAFKDSSIEKIILPESVTHIDWFAFSGCKRLCEITIPASVTSVGYGAFDNCSGFLVIKCEKGSYIEAFAASWGILSVAD